MIERIITSSVLLLLMFDADPLMADNIVITRPLAGRPALGRVEIVAEIDSAPIRYLEAQVDGRSLGRLEDPPYRWMVELGEENREHRFEVRAVLASGESIHTTLVTPILSIDEEVDLILRQIYVTATRNGETADDLSRSDFTVIDAGRRQTLVTFERGDVPLTALLLLDASRSMHGEQLETALSSARSFVDGMHELDRAMLMLFADRLLRTTPFTGFSEVLTAGLGGVEGLGSTALNDHLYVALRLIEARQGRRVVVLLSDGIDNVSVLDMEQVSRVARRSQTMIYWLRLGAVDEHLSFSSAWRGAEGHRRELQQLARVVRQSGGEIIDLADATEAHQAFAEVLEELRGQYVLGYYPERDSDGRTWRPVRVRTVGRGVKLRYREGYVD